MMRSGSTDVWPTVLPDKNGTFVFQKFKKEQKITNIWQKMFMSGNAVIW